jgi:hypothetical protein
MDLKHIRFGLAFAMLAILFGGLMGLGFGCCEDSFKDKFKEDASSVLKEKYNGDQNKADKVSAKSWVYMKRAHLHSQTMGVISIVLSLIAAGLAFPPLLQTYISLMSGLGSIGYGLFWFLAGFLAPGMGSTGIAKKTVGLVGQVSAGSFFIAVVGLFCMLGYKIFTQKVSPHK